MEAAPLRRAAAHREAFAGRGAGCVRGCGAPKGRRGCRQAGPRLRAAAARDGPTARTPSPASNARTQADRQTSDRQTDTHTQKARPPAAAPGRLPCPGPAVRHRPPRPAPPAEPSRAPGGAGLAPRPAALFGTAAGRGRAPPSPPAPPPLPPRPPPGRVAPRSARRSPQLLLSLRFRAMARGGCGRLRAGSEPRCVWRGCRGGAGRAGAPAASPPATA